MKNEQKKFITPIEDHPVTISGALVVSVFLTLLAQYIWEDPILNFMAALAPILALVATVALRAKEEEDGEEETFESEENTRYAFFVLISGYLSAFLVRAMPQQYVWMAFMTLATTVSYVFFRLADRHKRKKELAYEQNILDVPIQMDDAAVDEFVEEGARESFYASLIEAQAGRRH